MRLPQEQLFLTYFQLSLIHNLRLSEEYKG
ncbi:hypothetical protein CY0110_15732 [Crocosphaera chwakensis CCY0110]|uniref:Uncharacterized protein n=1 Tax=Crocosphaera chwakensis CCY0110 TaxID=391612 RepID=A3IHH8_9CHRO|nr:hypothetical protein CY0110_15732 [Crocosphaera chwakensis CCY0110]